MVRNTRAKIRRTEDKYGIDLTNDIFIPDDIGHFKTRKEFNEWKEQQQSFTNRANLDYQFVKNKWDVVASKREIAEVTRATKQAQRIAKEEYEKVKDLPQYVKGDKIGTVESRTSHMAMPDVTGIHVPKDFDFDKTRSRQRLQTVSENMERRSDVNYFNERRVQMHENYISMVENAFNSDGDEVIEYLQTINPDDFYEMYLMFPEVFNFDIYYPMEGIETSLGTPEQNAHRMVEYLKNYTNNKYDTDLNGF